MKSKIIGGDKYDYIYIRTGLTHEDLITKRKGRVPLKHTESFLTEKLSVNAKKTEPSYCFLKKWRPGRENTPLSTSYHSGLSEELH